jgi:hypothetical protein
MEKRVKNSLEGILFTLIMGGLLSFARVELGSWHNVYDVVKTTIDVNTPPLFYHNNFYK